MLEIIRSLIMFLAYIIKIAFIDGLYNKLLSATHEEFWNYLVYTIRVLCILNFAERIAAGKNLSVTQGINIWVFRLAGVYYYGIDNTRPLSRMLEKIYVVFYYHEFWILW
jgi:hypothetical protein